MFFVVAPHLVARGQMEAATTVAKTVGQSLRTAPGFIHRLVCHGLDDPNKVWSLVAWDTRDSFDAWLKARRFPWTDADLHRIYEKGALVGAASTFDLIAEQGEFFAVTPPEASRLGRLSAGAPVAVVAPHVLSDTETELAARMVREVGESIRQADGFIGRVEIQSRESPLKLWSMSVWHSHAQFKHWADHRKFWWTPEDVKRVFPVGAMVEDAQQLEVVWRD